MRLNYKMLDIAANLIATREKVLAAAARRPLEYQQWETRLVGASKIKPPEIIIEAYEAGLRHFGENYVNELVEKSSNKDILEKCKEIKWHFIGHLQKNKVNKVLAVPNLFVIETIDNEKLATAVDKGWLKFRKDDNEKLNVMVQVNTSNEDAKSGCAVENVVPLVKFILENCNNLKLIGLMTIGLYGYDTSKGPNPDFLCLRECRERVCKELDIDIKNMELSMGMSSDFEQAIELGSTNVRVGTTIFGERPKKPN